MKIFYTMMCMLIASTVFVSCSKDNDTPEQENDMSTHLTKTNETRAKGFNYFEANEKIVRDIEENKPKLPLTQTTIEYYKDLISFEGSINASDANRVADEVLLAQDLGVDKWLNENMSFSQFTNNMIMQIVREGPIRNLEQVEGFHTISYTEQDLLIGANGVAISYAEGMGRQQLNDPFAANRSADPLMYAYTGGVCGFIIGHVYFGALGGVIGAIIGGSVGYVVGWIANGFQK